MYIVGNIIDMPNFQVQHLVHLLHLHAQNYKHEIALRHKQLGVWQEWSWQALLEKSQHYAGLLKHFNFQENHHVLLLSPPNVDVIALSLAAQALGGSVQLIDSQQDDVLNPVYLDVLQPQFVLVEELAQLEGVTQSSFIPQVIFHIEPAHLNFDWKQNETVVFHLLSDFIDYPKITFDQLILDSTETAFRFEYIENKQLSSVSYTHKELITEAGQLVEKYALNPSEQAFVARSFSSVGHIRYLWSSWLLAGFTLNIPEVLATRDQDRQVIAPTLVLGTKQSYERVYQLILSKLVKKNTWLFNAFQQSFISADSHASSSLIKRLIKGLYRQSILEELGFSQLRTALIVGEQVSEEAFAFYQALDLHLQPWNEPVQWIKRELKELHDHHQNLAAPAQ